MHVPEFMTEIVAEMSQQARRSPHINQRSGVSVRLSIANYETLVAERDAPRAAQRRATRSCRVSATSTRWSPSTAGKVEFETVDDGREEQILDRLVKASVLETFRARCRPEKLVDLVKAFDEGLVVHTGADVSAAEYAKVLPELPALSDTLTDLEVGETPAGVASAVEFVLEGLHLSKRLNKDAVGAQGRVPRPGLAPLRSGAGSDALARVLLEEPAAVARVAVDVVDGLRCDAWNSLSFATDGSVADAAQRVDEGRRRPRWIFLGAVVGHLLDQGELLGRGSSRPS